MLVNLVNNNPQSPNPVRIGDGIFGGRVVSRDKYYVYDSEPPFPFSYRLWIVNDFQVEKRRINVSSEDKQILYCQFCDTTCCEHIRAVLVHEDKNGRSLNQLAMFCINGWGRLLEAGEIKRVKFWAAVRVYANRKSVTFSELSAEITRITK